jgi:hypothetical protein
MLGNGKIGKVGLDTSGIRTTFKSMKIKVLSVDEQKGGERPWFKFVDEKGRDGLFRPARRFLQNNPCFTAKPGDDLDIGDCIPDFLTGDTAPVFVPESIRKC